MRSGRSSWTARIGASRLLAIKLAIRGGRVADAEIYATHGLESVARFGTFRKWATNTRRQFEARREETEGAAVELPADHRSRWGTRGLGRLRQLGMGTLTGPAAEAVAWSVLLGLAEDLRRDADLLAGTARAMMRLTTGSARRGTSSLVDTLGGSDEGRSDDD